MYHRNKEIPVQCARLLQYYLDLHERDPNSPNYTFAALWFWHNLLAIRFAGTDSGLKVMLNLEIYEYMNGPESAPGFKVVFVPCDEHVFRVFVPYLSNFVLEAGNF